MASTAMSQFYQSLSMLKTIYIKNYILIDEIKIDFQSGLNIITGETGAGKSILIGALGGLLGEKLGKDIIRTGAEKAIVEGEFMIVQSPAIRDFLLQNELEDSPESLLIRREVSINGKNRCFINDQPVPSHVLVSLGDLLVDLHGQHEHQLLLQVGHHGEYLDEFAGLSNELAQYKEYFLKLLADIKQLREIEIKAKESEKSRDFMQFQLNEISAISPQPDEDEVLKAEEQILRNAEVLFQRTSKLFQKLYETEGSAAEILAAAETDLQQLSEIDNTFLPMVSECQNAGIIVQELAKAMQHYGQDISFDPDRLEKIRTRAASLANLKRKYGGTIDTVITFQEKLRTELSLIENLDETISTMKMQIEQDREQVSEVSLQISAKRRQAAQDFSEKVLSILANLGMPKARFLINQHHTVTQEEPFVLVEGEMVRIGPRGFDHIEFLLAANPGEDYKPLAVVASGGEISRVMLALKSILAEADKVPVLIFDEIDIGISGRIAQAVGRSLQALARSHQVLCITHLPQIASMADHHLLVEKEGDDHQTRTMIRSLRREERVEQIATLFGGETVTAAHLRSAEELLQEAGRS